ncbi:MAG TPA: HAMP domain-containing sensor histidine kinase [Bacteroidales bacterium]|nr:hypothetical protein [Bacteroidales bacterium]HOU96548.1 HAMP domain-containing sensor histidine kinase [Bacteroidales bacterium]HQG37111.1 HAMP domain-containing sensor histidine kinase [Bacteroidales bacterium]HQG53611.1 HAMP domain-containing sensor histidine kinase [Bacteroidales bacterium]HQJ21145.1 HAMP domain-containing sensor histidine kinase [Bacteroidales bacterium]
MKNRIFIGLVLMMVLSVAGITYVQITWMRNAIRTTNENFNNAVFLSLNNAAGEIETYQRMNAFNKNILNFPFTVQKDTSSLITGYLSFGSFFSASDQNVSFNFSSTSTNQQKFSLKSELKNDSLNKNNYFESDSIVFVISSKAPGEVKILKKKDLNKSYDNLIVMTQLDFLQWISKRSNELRNMSDRLIREIFELEVNFYPEQDLIRDILNQVFPYYGINTPYEFSIIENDEPVLVSSEKIKKNDFMKSIYKVKLFDDNIIRPEIMLSVVFPNRTNYLLGSISWMLIGSSLFSLFILSTFALSIYFILRQKKISDVKSDFINNMTHEFKTPIATISLAADTIMNPKVIHDDKSVSHFVGMIKKENERMNKQVETILQIASLEKKEIDFKFDNVSVHQIIEKAIDTIELFAHQKNGVISTDLSASPDIVYGDAEHLTNLVHNLLDNALKYSPDKPDIKIITQNADGGLILIVEDKGIGMSKSVQSKIFERFYRQASGDVHDVKGFGLGLNYVKAILDAHKGKVNIESEPGKGSRFTVFLPFKFENGK